MQLFYDYYNSKKKKRHQIAILLFQTDVKSLRTPENATVLLASLTNSWSVHNRKKLLNIINKKFVKQPFIPLLQSNIEWHQRRKKAKFQ